jgi:hypothetical protein
LGRSAEYVMCHSPDYVGLNRSRIPSSDAAALQRSFWTV